MLGKNWMLNRQDSDKVPHHQWLVMGPPGMSLDKVPLLTWPEDLDLDHGWPDKVPHKCLVLDKVPHKWLALGKVLRKCHFQIRHICLLPAGKFLTASIAKRS